MVSSRSLLLFTLLSLVAGYTVDPPTTAPSDTIEDCTNWIVATSSDTCTSIAANYALTSAQLYRYNPSLAASCGLTVGLSYCVEENWGIPPVETTTSATSTSTTSSVTSTTTGNGVTTPTPTQPGMVANCNKFYFVTTGQSCSDVLAANNIDLATFYSYNSGVGATCSGMWAEVYVCVGVTGTSVPTSTITSTTTTAPGNGVTTPTPTQPGMVSNCNKFYYVSTGQSCSDVLAANNIALATFYAYNSGVGSTCSGMWAEVYVCVDVIGGGTTTTTTSSTTTSAGNGISTPTPTQPGMVSNCDKFDFVDPGTDCSTILSRNGLTVAQLYALNSGVGPTCSGMWASVYVCVHAIGTSTTLVTSTTTSGNGIATPTPTMAGMVTYCKTFYKVVSGDTCDAISSKTGASVANIIAWNTQAGSNCNVWLDYYICVGV